MLYSKQAHAFGGLLSRMFSHSICDLFDICTMRIMQLYTFMVKFKLKIRKTIKFYMDTLFVQLPTLLYFYSPIARLLVL